MLDDQGLGNRPTVHTVYHIDPGTRHKRAARLKLQSGI